MSQPYDIAYIIKQHLISLSDRKKQLIIELNKLEPRLEEIREELSIINADINKSKRSLDSIRR